MDATPKIDVDQQALWNGSAGCAWIDAQAALDQMFQPFEDLMVDTVAERGATRVLDVGCGTGATTLAIARAVGTDGHAAGIDISAPMLAVARDRAARESSRATFIQADAQTYDFEPAAFDLIVSRFGIMFFDDPVRAFANLRRAATERGALRGIAWRSPAENPFMTTAERAAAPLLPALPARRPDGPGQFALADRSKVSSMLESSGWTDVDVRPIDVECVFPATALDMYVTRLGPVGQALQQADDETRARVTDAVRSAFAPFVNGAEVRFTAACWMVGAG